ncbi:MAG: hypothetical protein KGH53_02210 [Candidatus Micrarchaeota archaeon]|nr:hypothetical protein [Candidatus Micrarchaeota archaeon]
MGNSQIKIQSATEYLLTYGWAFLIIAIAAASLYLFVFAPSTLTASTCTFTSGVYCQDLVLGSSSTLSKMAMLLTNSNPYPILNPKMTLNLTGVAPILGTCIPNFILPGGAIICNATIIPAISQSALASGRFILSYTPCPGGNVIQCQSNPKQSYTGSFNTHASPLLSQTTISITLTPQNTSQVAISSSLDKLTANVRLLGTPLSGATVNFTSNSINAPINPLVTTTDGLGNASSYISSSATGNVLISASFANQIANSIISFTAPVCFTISVPGLSGATSNALTIDGVGYSSFPQQLCYGKGTSHSYSFQTTVAGGTGIQYLFNSVSGCGATTQSGILSGVANCTLNGNYITQYYLTTSASPGIGGAVTPPSGWYNSGNSATLGETPSAGYAFNGWTGTGTGSYSGSSASPAITLNSPITETGSFTSTTTSTTTTSSTSTTSTSSTSTSTTSTTSTSTSTSTTIAYVYCVSVWNNNANSYAQISNSGIGGWNYSTSTYPQLLESPPTICASYNNYIYCVGGYGNAYGNGNTDTPFVYYAPLSATGIGTWTTTTPYPTGIQGNSCVSSNGYIYCIAGSNSGASDTTNVYYAPVSASGVGSWGTTTSYPIPAVQIKCLVYNGYIYCVGGDTISRPYTTLNSYYAPISSSGIGTWSSTTSSPVSLSGGSCAAYSSYIYCISPSGGASPSLVYYAPISASGIGTWTATTSYPDSYVSGAECITHNGDIYCITSEGYQTRYAQLNPGVGQWISTTQDILATPNPSYCTTYP